MKRRSSLSSNPQAVDRVIGESAYDVVVNVNNNLELIGTVESNLPIISSAYTNRFILSNVNANIPIIEDVYNNLIPINTLYDNRQEIKDLNDDMYKVSDVYLALPAITNANDAYELITNLSTTSTTLDPGEDATVDLTGSILAFGIPKGEKGDKGDSVTQINIDGGRADSVYTIDQIISGGNA